MQLMWPFMLLLLVPIAALWVWRLIKPAKRQPWFVGEAITLGALPSFAKMRRRGLLLRIVEMTLLGAVLVLLAFIAARPQAEIRKVDFQNSRDIVLCLDASGSMQQFMPDELNALNAIVKANPTDRYSLVLFQNVPFVALPLTSDVAAIDLKTKDLATQLSNTKTFTAAQSAGFDANVPGGGTDIGAGLAGCVRRFDNLTQPRSRHIILISDMQNNGVTDQATVAALLPKYGITLHILAPHNDIGGSAAQSVVTQITGAQVSDLTAAGGVQQVVSQILNSIVSKQKNVQYVAVDAPYAWWDAVIIVALLWGLVQLLRWRWRT